MRSSEDGAAEGSGDVKSSDAKLHRRISMTERLNIQEGERRAHKENNTERLHHIIEEPQLRTLFRDFLRENFCEENLAFYLEVQDFKRKFNITSSAVAAMPSNPRNAKVTPGQAAMEKHHETLIRTAFEIYNTYLAPSSQCELNIDHGLRNELANYLNEVITNLTGKAFQGRVEMEQANAFNATQLQVMIRLYERIQTHVFRLMATDSVPKVRCVAYSVRLVTDSVLVTCSLSRRRGSPLCASNSEVMKITPLKSFLSCLPTHQHPLYLLVSLTRRRLAAHTLRCHNEQRR